MRIIINLKQSHLRKIIKTICFLAGNYNINMLKINEQEHCSRFFDTLTYFSIFFEITLPIRFTTFNGALIDYYFNQNIY